MLLAQWWAEDCTFPVVHTADLEDRLQRTTQECGTPFFQAYVKQARRALELLLQNPRIRKEDAIGTPASALVWSLRCIMGRVVPSSQVGMIQDALGALNQMVLRHEEIDWDLPVMAAVRGAVMQAYGWSMVQEQPAQVKTALDYNKA